MVAAKKADFAGIGAELDIDPVIVRIMRNRGMTEVSQMRAFLRKDESAVHDPFLLPDMDRAVDIILNKLSSKARIRIIGDYDVDGVTSTTILYKGFAALGADISYAIPNRVTDGYGINEAMIEKAHEDGIDTIVTCDNGIAAVDAVAAAKAYGMTVVVTDHHEVPYTDEDGVRTYIYPKADALIDPKIPDCGYPYSGICGAMVAYKLMCALNDRILSRSGSAENDMETEPIGAIPAELMGEMSELAALGTVCDVMELTDENRAVVSRALKTMSNSRNLGIRALRRVSGTEDKAVAVHELGFIIGPCINATGRLDSADLSVELLLAEDMDEALLKATELKNLNDLRKSYTEEGEKAALRKIEDEQMTEDKVMILYIPDLHESLAGIVAGRIKEDYYRPTIVFTDSEDGIKGSGRSIEGYNMYDELNKCRELYTRFGGHAMAAGLSMPEENLDKFRAFMQDNCRLTEDELTPKIVIDVPMPMGYVTEDLIGQIALLEPFGTGNPSPIFADKGLKILSIREMGKTGDMCKIRAEGTSGGYYELIMFRGYERLKEDAVSLTGSPDPTGLLMDAIYYPDINEYNGRRSIQYIIKDYRLS